MAVGVGIMRIAPVCKAVVMEKIQPPVARVGFTPSPAIPTTSIRPPKWRPPNASS